MQGLGSFVIVGAGGFLGSLIRYSFGLLFSGMSRTWPAGTFLSNILACLLIGFIAETGLRSGLIRPEMRIFLLSGLCGGMSTMSSFVYETIRYLQDSEILNASLYFFGTLVLCVACLMAGIWISRITVR